MKAQLLALVAVALFAVTINAQRISDREREGLVGPVRIVRAETVSANRAGESFKPDGKARRLGDTSYDEEGNYTVLEVIDDYGFAVGEQTFKYTNGRLTSTRLIDTKGEVLESREYAYGALSEYERVTITDRSGHAYDEHYKRGRGDRIEAIRHVEEGREAGTTAFTYRSDAQKPDEIAFFMPDGKPATATIGPCLGAHRIVYRYADGRVSERELYEEDGSLKRKSSFKYDDHGNLTEEARLNGPWKSVLQYEYRYDDRGNWIRRVETNRYDVDRASEPESPLLRITTRLITYF